MRRRKARVSWQRLVGGSGRNFRSSGVCSRLRASCIVCVRRVGGGRSGVFIRCLSFGGCIKGRRARVLCEVGRGVVRLIITIQEDITQETFWDLN